MRILALRMSTLLLTTFLCGCSSSHPGVYAGSAVGSTFGSAVRVDGHRSKEAVYWGGLLGAGMGYLGESVAALFSSEDPSGREYVVRVPAPNPYLSAEQ